MIDFGVLKYKLSRVSKKKLSFASTFPINKRSKVKEELVGEILEKLSFWEQQNGFLDNKITLHRLAKELNTNSSYLSKVINTHKNQNFASYLKDVRITYAINHLKEKPEIVKTKSMIQIAEMYGFNSLSVFTKTFKNKTGVTPGVFFKRILEDEWERTTEKE
ncbi:transcriptional regulator, AraC family [Allomuricauda ruestringensis DSM 13258]|uniref:Transcriptional regulator, AraC family n=1 Tax=Allomuricauda ruestringensis (strain DSM 13258 / CIP 107369 / LMG 19739 / B1) TaxID=886377 RepID=G2PKS0_ALLRU|nr:helix-turn-helix transcriptional regulator [Allomuricauda ruestringensis]AEM72116.1 transcriptional regulator, AraC family [Allomuricauda ruestringensis DSM 13258]